MCRKQGRLSSRSSSTSTLAVVFTGLLLIMTIPSAPVLLFVFAENIQGTFGDDTLNGTDEADTISGFEGNDTIFGEAGDDILDGGPGSDEIRGADGIDEIKDESGEWDRVYGGSDNDQINVGTSYQGTDFYYIYGEGGSDSITVLANADIRGGLDDDTIYCAAFQCAVNGEEGHDEIHIEAHDTAAGFAAYGGIGNDELYIEGGGGELDGNNGNDYLQVNAGGDLDGGEGDDILEALNGATFYHGGPGADTFNCSAGSGDQVLDFNSAEGDTVSANCEQVNLLPT